MNKDDLPGEAWTEKDGPYVREHHINPEAYPANDRPVFRETVEETEDGVRCRVELNGLELADETAESVASARKAANRSTVRCFGWLGGYIYEP